MKKIFSWRREDEPFRGITYVYGNYRIVQHGEVFTGYHAGEIVSRSKYWSEVADACQRHANSYPKGWESV